MVRDRLDGRIYVMIERWYKQPVPSKLLLLATPSSGVISFCRGKFLIKAALFFKKMKSP